MIRGSRRADANSEVKLPFGRHVKINGGKELLLLVAQWIESCDRPIAPVVLQSTCNLLREVVAEFSRGRKSDALIHTRTVERAIQRRVERQIPLAKLAIHNRTQF